ncbi:MAG TPA: glutamate 5-kinase [Rhodothermales bacterium]|nr:glutamate 5-kinase [Rhodothermales bacterium]
MKKPILVFKVGTSSLTHSDGRINEVLIRDFARQLAGLQKRYHIVMVSSGAVGAGKKYLRRYSGQMSERKAAAAVGNPLLISMYFEAFRPYDIGIAQSLCERRHFSDRKQFLQLKQTYKELWANGIIPIANENDVVSDYELKFSDNDELATLIAVGFGAELLLIGTSVPGVLDANGQVVREIATFTDEVLGLAHTETSAGGLGGMISKLTFARLATGLGVKVIIFQANQENSLLMAEQQKVGTVCPARDTTTNARRKWLASGCLLGGRIKVDKGAQKALMERKSLLAVGIEKVVQPFNRGEVIEIMGHTGRTPFAVGRVKVSSGELVKTKNLEVAHADEIVLL